jgi:hypothetical protein
MPSGCCDSWSAAKIVRQRAAPALGLALTLTTLEACINRDVNLGGDDPEGDASAGGGSGCSFAGNGSAGALGGNGSAAKAAMGAWAKAARASRVARPIPVA